MRKFVIFVMVIGVALASENNVDDKNTLKCLVGHLKSRGVNEDFFDSISTTFSEQVDCAALINARLSKAYTKIQTKLNADNYFSKYSNCIITDLRQKDANTEIMLRREAIKLNGVGIAVWNYFSQKEYLDKLKKEVENNLNASAQRCINAH